MFNISKNIYQAIKGTDITIEKLSVENANGIIGDIENKYINYYQKGRCLWDRFADYSYISNCDAWKYIKDFIKDDECIMFFNKDDDENMFKISCGDDLDYILSESCGFEFYITNLMTSFVLCFNDHDILYGVGEAKQWIEKYYD